MCMGGFEFIARSLVFPFDDLTPFFQFFLAQLGDLLCILCHAIFDKLMLKITLLPFHTGRYHKGCFRLSYGGPTSENDFKRHTFRGSRSILLLNNMDKKQINETGWKSFVFQNRNVRLICLVRRTSYSHSVTFTKDDDNC